MSDFVVKDSGERTQFNSGMVRDVTTGKIDYSLAMDGPMFKRLAIHLTKGAVKYAKRNWMKATGSEEYERFRESALRHFLQWYWGDVDEDHAAAVYFNVNGAEYVKQRMQEDNSAKQPSDLSSGSLGSTGGGTGSPRPLGEPGILGSLPLARRG